MIDYEMYDITFSGRLAAIQSASNNLLNYEMVCLVVYKHEKQKISDKKALEYITRIVNDDGSWLEEFRNEDQSKGSSTKT